MARPDGALRVVGGHGELEQELAERVAAVGRRDRPGRWRPRRPEQDLARPRRRVPEGGLALGHPAGQQIGSSGRRCGRGGHERGQLAERRPLVRGRRIAGARPGRPRRRGRAAAGSSRAGRSVSRLAAVDPPAAARPRRASVGAGTVPRRRRWRAWRGRRLRDLEARDRVQGRRRARRGPVREAGGRDARSAGERGQRPRRRRRGRQRRASRGGATTAELADEGDRGVAAPRSTARKARGSRSPVHATRTPAPWHAVRRPRRSPRRAPRAAR